MLIVGEAVVEDSVATALFRCDLEACRGACCTIPGGRGAPLDDAEVGEVMAALPAVEVLLSARNRAVIATTGPFEGGPGDRSIVCVDNRDCAFSFYEGGIARCSFERAFEKGSISWRKPLSCHLFPVRSRAGGREVLRYEEIDECRAARRRGTLEGVALHLFLEVPLKRKFGDGWYRAFREEARRVAESSEP